MTVPNVNQLFVICYQKNVEFGGANFSPTNYRDRIKAIKRDKAQTFDCFSLAIDETTDVSDIAEPLIFVRGIDENFTFYEELVKMCSLKGTTTREDLFHHLEQALDSLQFSWEKLTSVTTDGGKNMIGQNKGVAERIISKVKDSGSTVPLIFHCIVHQEALCSKVISWKEII
ncbi:General transcription factor II-I repeat domain-containing protein 2 [Eumeta japonica]|uniref:General transcription factor II-I repeat domain-containing protein 2 n=1 Tax=Eumeta variegata TaxID=151549 RepID=A0A4C1TY37_EUMVA|nr:General transcription factor II-I repeat domain-containing protein 2 [Eumeta japonica]